MYKILFFEAMEPLTEDFHETYCDCLFSMQCDYRPMLGDIFYLGRPSGTDTLAIAYEVEALVCVNNRVFHAYCVRVEPDDSYPPYYGARGVRGSLVAHTEDQIQDFPERYKHPASDA